MLKGAVRQPLAPPVGAAMASGAAGAAGGAASADAAAKRRHESPTHQAHQHEGKERVLPLIQRPVHLRLDVLPFALGYLALILLDAQFTSGAAIILVDVLYVALLLGQLALFLKCQWDPLWHASIAYRRYRYQPPPSSLRADIIDGKMQDMTTWTHCLVVPPNPYATSDEKASQTVRPERAGIVPVALESASGGTSLVATIHFRGWTYRCCCNAAAGLEEEHADRPMESIWQPDGEGSTSFLGEISDGEDEFEDDKKATGKYGGSCATLGWEPHFHRLHFPIDLPLQFYARWTGHASDRALQSTRRIFGRNQTVIPLPPYLSLLTQQLLQPMFLFQLLCVTLWCMDEYWMYAVFTLMTLLLFESVQALNRWRSVKRLREEVVGADVGAEANNTTSAHHVKQRVECYRQGEWTTLPTNELVVGDVVGLASPSAPNGGRHRSIRRGAHDHERGSTVPADLLLLRGRAVVNEAMLTGESVPQVKESIEAGDDGDGARKTLDLGDGAAHKRCVLFGGTTLMDHHSAEEDGENGASGQTPADIPPPPNQGLVCFVLRTGFDTIQGQLLRTLAYHAEAGGGSGSGGEGVNAKETFYFLLILLLCALASAGSVVHHAWGDVTRNHFKLVLHVVIIITSVIPPELPMELSLAVTTSLGELVKRYQVYCTEPFRIPLAGLVDTCCFDKTGTLTSDEMRLHGVRLPDALGQKDGAKKGELSGSNDDADLILFDSILSKNKASLSDENDDSNRKSPLQALLPRDTLRVMVGCQSLAVTHVFVPGRDGRTVVQTELCGDPLEKAVVEGCGFTIHPKTDLVVEKDALSTAASGGGSLKVLHRFAFSSKLRRMTVLALDADTTDTLWALTKGAPEALKPMLDPNSLPPDYEQSYLRHMTLGRRVLALGYRDLGKNTPSALAKWKSSRDSVEQKKLVFAGLLVMDSPLKADSARVVRELRLGNQNVIMVTGDAVLTAAEVARRVGIIDSPKENTYEICIRSGDATKFLFRPLDSRVGGNSKETKEFPYSPSNLGKLLAMVQEGSASFCVAGDVLTKLAIHAVELNTAVKSGPAQIDDRTVLNHPAAKAALSQLVPIISVFARHAPRHKEAVIAAFNASGRHTLMCGDGTNDVGALKQAHVGVSIVSVPDLEKKQRDANDAISAAKAEEKRERKKMKAKEGKGKGSSTKTTKQKRSRAEGIERSLQAIAEAEDELHFVSLGNASVASPFTSRKTSVRCCKDILQQGRCTLVTMIQIYKILGVQCLVNALVLTTLHQKGVKQGDRQLTAVSLVVAMLFLFVTRGKPLPKLSTQKPPSSVLCKETLLSMTVQFGIHFVAIMAATVLSELWVDSYDPSIVPDGPFHPNTLNTATFLVTVLCTINAFLVNYRGRPYMEDLTENKLLLRSIQACYFVLFVCATEAFTPLNQLMQLSPLPTSGPPLFLEVGAGEASLGSVLHEALLQGVSLVGFRGVLCVIMCLDTALVSSGEKAIRSLFKNY
ncbi:hypothetical protein ACHAXT_008522 [Thalassiosira profunda]